MLTQEQIQEIDEKYAQYNLDELVQLNDLINNRLKIKMFEMRQKKRKCNNGN